MFESGGGCDWFYKAEEHGKMVWSVSGKITEKPVARNAAAGAPGSGASAYRRKAIRVQLHTDAVSPCNVTRVRARALGSVRHVSGFACWSRVSDKRNESLSAHSCR